MTNDELLQFFEKDTKMSKLDIFKPSDFNYYYVGKETTPSAAHCAEQANKILNKYIEKNGVKVYSETYIENWKSSYWRTESKTTGDTHQGYVINIELIEKKCTEHEPEWDAKEIPGHSHLVETFYRCKNCGVKLKAEWKEAE